VSEHTPHPSGRAPGDRPASSDPATAIAQTVSPGELAAVLSHVDLGEVLLVSPVALGRPDSPKSLLRTARGLFLIRRLAPRPDLFERALINLAVSQRLRDAGLRVPRVMEPLRGSDRDAGPLVAVGDRWFEVREFIPARPCEPTPDDAARLGAAAARIHGALARFSPATPVPVWRLQPAGSLRARLVPSPSLERAIGAHFDRIADLAALAVGTLNELGITGAEHQLIHADLHPGNVVFAGAAGDEPVILDVESALAGPPIADLAAAALHLWLRANSTDNHPELISASRQTCVGFDATAALFRGYHSLREQGFSPSLARSAPWLMIHAAACEIADASVGKHASPTVQGLVALVRRVLDEVLDRAGAVSALARAGH
jgi:hypothetical protein